MPESLYIDVVAFMPLFRSWFMTHASCCFCGA